MSKNSKITITSRAKSAKQNKSILNNPSVEITVHPNCILSDTPHIKGALILFFIEVWSIETPANTSV